MKFKRFVLIFLAFLVLTLAICLLVYAAEPTGGVVERATLAPTWLVFPTPNSPVQP